MRASPWLARARSLAHCPAAYTNAARTPDVVPARGRDRQQPGRRADGVRGSHPGRYRRAPVANTTTISKTRGPDREHRAGARSCAAEPAPTAVSRCASRTQWQQQPARSTSRRQRSAGAGPGLRGRAARRRAAGRAGAARGRLGVRIPARQRRSRGRSRRRCRSAWPSRRRRSRRCCSTTPSSPASRRGCGLRAIRSSYWPQVEDGAARDLVEARDPAEGRRARQPGAR